MAKEVKQALKAKASAEAGLKTTERQAKDLRGELHHCKINLATEKQLVKDLCEEVRKAKEAAQPLKEAAEAEKQAAYALGVQETQSRLTEEFSSLARDYCDITWGKALNAAMVPADSNLRLPESIYYDSDIRELPGSGSPPPEQPAQVSEAPTTDQALPATVVIPTDSRQDNGQGKRLMPLRARTRTRIREKARPQIPPSLSPSRLLTQKLPRKKLRTLVSSIYLFSLFIAFV